MLKNKKGAYFKLSLQQVVGGDTDHGPASFGVPTDRNQEQQIEMHAIKMKWK